MAEQERKKQSVINGAMVLAMAILASKVIGLLFKMPLTNMLGMGGMGFFYSAYNVYTPIFAISMAGLPVAIARMVAEDVALNRFREARKVFTVGRRMYLLIGTCSMLLLFLIAYPYAYYASKGESNSASAMLPAMFAIAPSVFFCCYMSAYRGYYEGLRNMTPTAVSQFLEALGKLVLGLLLCRAVVSYGEKSYQSATATGQTVVQLFGKEVSNLVEVRDAISPWAAAAAVFGVTFGSFLGMLFLMLRHKLKGDTITRVELVNSPKPLAGGTIIKRLIAMAVPMVACSLILNLTNLIDAAMIQRRILAALETDYYAVYAQFQKAFDLAVELERLNISDWNRIAKYLWGAYGTGLDFRTLVPVIVSSLGVSALPAMSEAWIMKDKANVRSTVETVLRVGMLIALPAGFGMALLAGPILTLIYGRGNSSDAVGIVIPIMAAYGYGTALMAISTPITNMLQAIGRTDIPIKTMIVAAAVKVTCNYILVGNPKLTIYGAVVGTILFYVIVVAFNLTSLLRVTKVKIRIGSVFLKPLCCALLCGASARIVYWAFVNLLQNLSVLQGSGLLNAPNLALVFAIGIAVLVYAAALLWSRAITKDEVTGLPQGEKIAKVLEKHGLLG